MNNICIEEIREALTEAKDECATAECKTDDVKGMTSDLDSAADDAAASTYEAGERVQQAIDLLDGLKEDYEEGINPEGVTVFLKHSQSVLLTISRAVLSLDATITSFAKTHDIDAPSPLNKEE